MTQQGLRTPRRRVDGVLLLDKPLGVSSNVALQRARRLFEAQRAGHTGTLDPLASGLLPIRFGEATKFSQTLLDAPKRYRATVRFGSATTTGDAEGEVIDRKPVAFDRAALEAALARFTGTIMQTPPAYAALKRAGRPYYEYARAGVEIQRSPRNVLIYGLTLVDWTPSDAVLDVECSKGTYVRVLAEDLGRALGSCGHLAGLRRNGNGRFRIEDAIAIDALEALDTAGRTARLLPVDAGLASLPLLEFDASEVAALRHGLQLSCTAAAARYRAYGPEGFLGVIDADGGRTRAVRLVADAATERASDQDARSA